MAQEDFTALTNEWTAFSSLVTVDASATYKIQNRGADPLVALESSSIPAANAQGGDIVLPYWTAYYKKGTQDLYLRAFNSGCSINITKVE